MAELDVQPKSRTPWWLWLLLLLIALALLFFFLRGCNNKTGTATTTDSTATTTDSTSTTKVGTTHADFSSVDFNAPKASYEEITDTTITVQGGDKYAIYSLGENVLFATDQSAVQSSADKQLKQIASSLEKRFKNSVIGIYGRTDDEGSKEYNKGLGAQRAAAVREWLINNGKLDSTKIYIKSLGESKPIATNATAQGRQQNRSVEIVAVPDSASH